ADLRFPAPSHASACTVAYCRVTPRLQWRHRDGVAPSSPALTVYLALNPFLLSETTRFHSWRSCKSSPLSCALATNVVGAKTGGAWYHIGEVPVKCQDSGPVRCMRQKPLSVLHDQTRSLPEIKRRFGACPVTDNQRKPCFIGPLLPFPIRTMNPWPPRC